MTNSNILQSSFDFSVKPVALDDPNSLLLKQNNFNLYQQIINYPVQTEGRIDLGDRWVYFQTVLKPVNEDKHQQQDNTQICKRCSKEQPLDNFHKDGSGYKTICKNCRSQDYKNKKKLPDFNNVIEQAQVIETLITCGNMTHDEAGNQFNMSGGWVRDQLKLLELPTETQELIIAKKLNITFGRGLYQIKKTKLPELDINKWAEKISREKWKTEGFKEFILTNEPDNDQNLKKN